MTPRIPRPVDQSDIDEIIQIFGVAETDLIKGIYYFDGWSDYEEYGGLLIFQGIDDSIQAVEYGYCVMAPEHENCFYPEDISECEMEARIEWMEKVIKGNETNS